MRSKVHLRALVMGDLTFLDQIENNPDNWSISDTTEAFSKELLIEYINHANKPISEVGQQRFVIALTDETPVGFIDLFDFNYLHKRAGVGIVIEKEYRVKGYATQAIKLMCDYALKELKLNQLYATILEDNKKSIALFEQIGFKRSGVKSAWHFSNGSFKDEYLYQYFL